MLGSRICSALFGVKLCHLCCLYLLKLLWGSQNCQIPHGRFWYVFKSIPNKTHNFGIMLSSASFGSIWEVPGADPGAAMHFPAGSPNCRFPYGPKIVELNFWIFLEIGHSGFRQVWDLQLPPASYRIAGITSLDRFKCNTTRKTPSRKRANWSEGSPATCMHYAIYNSLHICIAKIYTFRMSKMIRSW